MNIAEKNGIHVIVDGQFGSTGKGALSAFLARGAVKFRSIDQFGAVLSNGGPNSGHTSYYGQEKIVLKQLPTFAVHAHMAGHTIPAYLSAGAIIDPVVLREEAQRYPKLPILISPNAAVITDEDRMTEQSGSIAAIASTQSGTGAALSRKVLRKPDAIAIKALKGDNGLASVKGMPDNVRFAMHRVKPENYSVMMEISQGFSLGLNQGFYPYCTSRECTVAQGLADAGLAPSWLAKVFMVVRTFPIRVGNLGDFSSGGWYPDQEEIEWDDIGQTPELTTVTKRVRRIATFSNIQFEEALRANDPEWVCINFLNYLSPEEQEVFIDNIRAIRDQHYTKFGIIGGWGPGVDSWRVIDDGGARDH